MRRTVYLLILVPGLLFADDVYLKGGAVFSGRIVEQTETMVTMDIGDGVVGVAVSRIERIVKGRSAFDEYDERAAGLAGERRRRLAKPGALGLAPGVVISQVSK